MPGKAYESRKPHRKPCEIRQRPLLAPHPSITPGDAGCTVRAGVSGVADRQKRTPDLQLTDSSDELTQRERNHSRVKGSGATSACTMKSPSAPGEAPEVVSDVSKVKYSEGWLNPAVWKCFTLRE